MTTVPSITAEIISIKAYIQAAQQILRDGYMPDITALEKRVADACQGNAPQPDALAMVQLPKPARDRRRTGKTSVRVRFARR